LSASVHELLGEPPPSPHLDQRLAFCLLDLAAIAACFEIAELSVNAAAVLTPMPARRHVVVESPTAMNLDHFVRPDPKFSITSAMPIFLSSCVVHDDGSLHELHQVLVGRHDGEHCADRAGRRA